MYKFIILIMAMLPVSSVKQAQLKFSRVKTAYDEKESVVKGYFKEKKINYPGFRLFIRAFKLEQQLEVWVKDNRSSSYTLLHTYAICANSGTPGPKRREGDFQVPEGVYAINHLNPESNFYLSLGISYPNASDKILSDKQHPGGNIYIHGNCVTVGCMPLTDDKIKELYVMAVEARNNGQDEIPVHVFPAHMTEANMNELKAALPQHSNFWTNLKPVYSSFEKNKTICTISVDKKGAYIVQ